MNLVTYILDFVVAVRNKFNLITAAIATAKTEAISASAAAVEAQKGIANGLVNLDQNVKIPIAYLPAIILGTLSYQGTFDASSGNFPANPSSGNFWVISTQGTLGGKVYKAGDWLVKNPTGWDKIDNSQTVTAVAGRTGDVVLTTSDIADLQTAVNGYIDARIGTAQDFVTAFNNGLL